jgi:peptidoglycan/LPS O-acetylase OafA/YrhL
VHMSYFYARRALRLLPALCFFLLVWFAVDLLFGHGQFLSTVPSGHTPGSPVSWITGLEAVTAALLYVTNWLSVEPSWHLWISYSPISHLWTLAVEEQFYVIWAPVMILLFLSGATFNRVYFGTDTRCAALFCGALCAFVGSTNGWRKLRTASWAPLLGAGIVGAIVWSSYALRQEGNRAVWNTGLIVCSLACALAVVFIVERPHRAAARALSSPLLVAIGKRSYALYLWSYVLNTWLRDTGALESFLVITTTFAAAEISYRFIELPALRFKHHFATTPPSPTPTATTDRIGRSAVPALAGLDEAEIAELGEKVLISRR